MKSFRPRHKLPRESMSQGFALLALQGTSEIIKRAAALRGYTRFESHYERPVQ